MTTVTTADAIWFIDNLARVRVGRRRDRRGTLAVVESEGRRGDMPPLHVHRREDEAFYLLEGEISAAPAGALADTRRRRGAFAPKDVPHAYRVESETGALARDRHACRLRRRSSGEVGEPAPEETLPPGDASTTRRGSRRSPPASGSSCSGLPGRCRNVTPRPWAGWCGGG